MDCEIDYFFSQDGLRLYYRHWECENPRSIVCIIHGLAEHSGRYDHIAKHLNDSQISVFGIDLRGHGLSNGKRGHAKNFEVLLNDVEELLKVAREAHTEIPMYLMGHSMGGNIVANYVLKKPVNELAGFILSSPWLKLAFEPPAWKDKLAKTVAGFWPSLTQPDGLDASDLSRDPQVVDDYKNDPLVHGKISAGLYIEGTNAAKNALENAVNIKIAGLVFHGSKDRIVDWNASKAFAESNDLISWKLIEGSYHEVLNDLDKDSVLSDITSWISNINNLKK
ncbi:MAG: lysophospholipase [Cyclobacteriaceae bacterium]